jgi:hypothetical protein
MDKKKLNFLQKTTGQIQFADNVIETELYISPAVQGYLISQYLNDLYKEPKSGETFASGLCRLSAETMLMINVLENCTSIDTDSISEDVFLSSQLYDVYNRVREVIHNFSDFRQVLDKTVEDRERQIALEYSVGKVLEGAVSKVIEAAEWFTNLKIDDAQLEELKKAAKEITEDLAKSPISQVLNEANKEKATKGKKVGRSTTAIKQ